MKLFSSHKTKDAVIYSFLGLRFRRRRKKKLERRVSELQEQVEALQRQLGAAVVPGDMPRASGYTRIVQMLCLQGLCEIDRICRKHNLSYWLAFGTLLGAVRHGGFIPWDDDLDICMMADDYEQFLRVVEEELKGSDYEFHVYPAQIGKLLHKDFMPENEQQEADFIRWVLRDKLCFAVDIFPCYRAAEGHSIEGLKSRLQEFSHRKAACMGDFSCERLREADALVKTQNAQLQGNGPLCFCGMELMLTNTNMQRLDDIFPLKELPFEGRMFYVPNKTHKVLTRIFGDYMKVHIEPSHLRLHELPLAEKEKLLKHADFIEN